MRFDLCNYLDLFFDWNFTGISSIFSIFSQENFTELHSAGDLTIKREMSLQKFLRFWNFDRSKKFGLSFPKVDWNRDNDHDISIISILPG
jgi:hypothetical protein